ELSVILRCGLIEEKCIRLFAGAGITAISDPASEFAETELKISALLERLSP
ncbi:MAG TPA: isochorismate synthase, partial [Chromatiaceae bacterium]|nr:isochorismate synthase [Chromatiaceae bacterium]